jgi:hypothetical protein
VLPDACFGVVLGEVGEGCVPFYRGGLVFLAEVVGAVEHHGLKGVCGHVW